MEKCENCKRKRITVNCMTCNSMFCTSCIQNEIHSCEKIDEKIKKNILHLELKNQKITTKKI